MHFFEMFFMFSVPGVISCFCRRGSEDVVGRRTALLSQEGSTIETAVEIVRGVVPKLPSVRMHSQTFRLGNHPSRHRKERDDAALLTQEGKSPPFNVTLAF